MQKQIQAFTLVELIVVITILAILGTVAFVSLSGYALTSRDTVRVTDINSLSKVVELHRLEEGTYPVITNPVNIAFSGADIWQQGSFGIPSRIDAGRISEIPVDPLTKNQYAYTTTYATSEYQIGTIIEGELVQGNRESKLYTFVKNIEAANNLSAFNTIKIKGNYNGKFLVHTEGALPNKQIYILGVPTLLTSIIADTTLETVIDDNKFVYEGGSKAPTTYSGSLYGDNAWDFSPTNPLSATGVIYQGTSTTLSTSGEKIIFIQNLRSYYAGTDIENNHSYGELKIIGLSSDPDSESITLTNTYIEAELGGLVEKYTGVSPSKE